MTKEQAQAKLLAWVSNRPSKTSAASTLGITTQTLRLILNGEAVPGARVAVSIQRLARVAPKSWYQ